MKNYKKYVMTVLMCSILLLTSCAQEKGKDANKTTDKKPVDMVTEDITTKDEEIKNNEIEDVVATDAPTKEPDKPIEEKPLEGFYNCVKKENHFVRVDFEIKKKEDNYVALFYSQYTPVNEYDYSQIFYGEKLEDNTYEFTCEDEKYTVIWNGMDQLIITGNEFGGTYERGVRDGYGEGEYIIKEIPSYLADKNVENGIELDATLGQAIRAELGLPLEHVLTYADLENVTYLATWDYEIVSVKGISYLKNLEEIHFGTNYISDISEMTKLSNIRVIDIGLSYVKEIPDFSQCDKLNALYLGGNMIEDLSSIAKIPNLEFLDVNSNFITSIEPLKNAKSLKTLCIYDNCILDYSAVADCGFLVNAYNDCGQCTFDDALTLEKRAKEIVATFPKNTSELELEKYIYKYIKDNMYYAENLRRTNAFGYYGIMEGSGVCGDYAEAFALLASHAGLEVYECDSDTHAWNIVKVDGKYYHCDALWDEDVEEWIHFNKSTGYISNLPDHTHDLRRYPICEVSMSKLEYFDY